MTKLPEYHIIIKSILDGCIGISFFNNKVY